MGKDKFGINYIDLDDENVISSLMPEIKTPPFGYDKKMMVIKNSGLFRKETKKKVQGLKELRDSLEKYIKENYEEVKQNLLLVFIEESVEKLNITKIFESIGGIICEFQEEKPLKLEKRLLSICDAYKVKTENGAIKELIEISGTNLQCLINEIRKLIEYAGERWYYNERKCIESCNKNIR